MLAADVVKRASFARLTPVLARRLGVMLEVRVATHGLTVEEVLWEAEGVRSTFIFDPAIFAHPHGAVLIERWIDVLPLLLGALSLCGASGRTSIALGDCGTGRGLTFCDHRTEALLIPDPVFVRTNGYEAHKQAFADAALPWDWRRPRALWRGQTSGWHDAVGQPVASWTDLPRIRLCRLARDPDLQNLLDAGITGIVQITASGEAESRILSDLMVPRLDWRRFLEWRYHIDVDGNTSAWEGLFVKLCTGSPVLKIASGFGFRQWYYDQLVPWTNVVPVAADLSDLAEKVHWLRRHDDSAAAIGRAARALADRLTLPGEIHQAAETIRWAFASA